MSGIGEAPRLWGKYRGKVLDVEDPLAMGRLLIEVPQVPATKMNWAMPCVPYAGSNVGFFVMPELGANVWVEFEAGDSSYPIWTGCYWAEGEAPKPEAEDPVFRKVFRTPGNSLLFDDTPDTGGITMTSKPPAVAEMITLKFTTDGAQILAPPAALTMSREGGITIEFPPGTISITEEALTATVPASTVVLNEEGVELNAPEVGVTADADVKVDAASVEVMAANTEVSGNLNVTLALEVEGDANVLGALEIEGETNALGLVTIEGELNVALSASVEGALTVLGLITMDGSPVMVVPI